MAHRAGHHTGRSWQRRQELNTDSECKMFLSLSSTSHDLQVPLVLSERFGRILVDTVGTHKMKSWVKVNRGAMVLCRSACVNKCSRLSVQRVLYSCLNNLIYLYWLYKVQVLILFILYVQFIPMNVYKFYICVHIAQVVQTKSDARIQLSLYPDVYSSQPEGFLIVWINYVNETCQ